MDAAVVVWLASVLVAGAGADVEGESELWSEPEQWTSPSACVSAKKRCVELSSRQHLD